MALSRHKTQLLRLFCLFLGLCYLSWSFSNIPNLWRQGSSSPSNTAMATTTLLLRDWFTLAKGWTLKGGAFESSGTNRTGSSHPLHQGSSNVRATDASRASMFLSPYILGSSQAEEKLEYTNSQLQKKNETKLILFYNLPDWMHVSHKTFQHCSLKACTISTDRSLFKKADAVMFHIFFFKDKQPPKHRPPGQIWVAFGLEAPYGLGSNMFSSEWARAFNWTMTYRVDSDVFRPYGLLKYRGKQRNKNYTQLVVNKRKSAAWFVSNCRTQSQRKRYVQQLEKHYPVDIFGGCGSHRCPRSQESDCISLLNSTYFFYLAFENSLCRDYVTEKFFKLFRSDIHIIPVVRGRSDYKKHFPPGTFVDTSEFKSPLHLARHLKWLESETEVYASMLSEKDQYVAVEALTSAMCQLCEKLHFNGSSKWYPNLPRWLFNGTCKTPTDITDTYIAQHGPNL